MRKNVQSPNGRIKIDEKQNQGHMISDPVSTALDAYDYHPFHISTSLLGLFRLSTWNTRASTVFTAVFQFLTALNETLVLAPQ